MTWAEGWEQMEGVIRAYLDFYFRQKRGEVLNGQDGRKAIIKEVMERCALRQIVETGTFRGASTEWFTRFGVPIHTVEVNRRFFSYSRMRLRGNTLVHQTFGDSIVFLRSFGERPENLVPTLFYLDAHWREHLPLAEELDVIRSRFDSAVVIIDDFLVPDDPDYGFDDYGPGRRLSLDYIADVLAGGFTAHFPRLPASQETGARRGSIVLGTPDMAAKLDMVSTLRRMPTAGA